jgi:hypothetical protein
VESCESKRILIVAHQSVATPALVEALRRRAELGPCTFVLLIPDGSGSVAAAWTARRARRMLSKMVGTSVEGIVAEDDDAYAGVVAALRAAPYDEIILSLLPDTSSRWRREDLPTRLEHLDVAVTVVTSAAVKTARS